MVIHQFEIQLSTILEKYLNKQLAFANKIKVEVACVSSEQKFKVLVFAALSSSLMIFYKTNNQVELCQSQSLTTLDSEPFQPKIDMQLKQETHYWEATVLQLFCPRVSFHGIYMVTGQDNVSSIFLQHRRQICFPTRKIMSLYRETGQICLQLLL